MKSPIDLVQLKVEVKNGRLKFMDINGVLAVKDTQSGEVVEVGYPEINCFDGKYRFLSNFCCEAPIFYLGHTYGSSEAAFQAQKCPERVDEFVPLAPGPAKRLGRKVEICTQWDSIKEGVMYEILMKKFSNIPLRDKLLATGESNLVEGNTWHDTYWGVCEGRGQNRLGYILMKVRELYRYPTEKVTEFDEQLRRSIAAYAVYKSNVFGDGGQCEK